jgi:hypothetical protein
LKQIVGDRSFGGMTEPKSLSLQRLTSELFLEIPELQPVNQLHLLVTSNADVQHELFITVHKLHPPFSDFDGYEAKTKTVNPHPILADLAMATKSVLNPFRQKLPNARKVRIKTGTNLSYQTRSFRTKAREPIQFTFWSIRTWSHTIGRLSNRAHYRRGSKSCS